MTQTQHFNQDDEWAMPTGGGKVSPTCGSSFGAAIVNDFFHIVGTGNGVEHFTVNGAGDFWGTRTFTGSVAVDLWNPANLDISAPDSNGNVTITPKPNTAPDYLSAGRLNEWDGFSGNKQNAVGTGTFSFKGTVDELGSVSLHGNSHFQWAVGADQNGPPTSGFGNFSVSCG